MSGIRVLVIDDDHAFIRHACISLETMAEVRALTSGQEALRSARGWQPDVVLLDLLIDDVDSFTLLDRLICPEGGRPPVVLCASHDSVELRLSPWAHWPVGIFPRSADPDELRSLVGAALDQATS